MTARDRGAIRLRVFRICRLHRDCEDCPLNGLRCSSPDGEVEEKLNELDNEVRND